MSWNLQHFLTFQWNVETMQVQQGDPGISQFPSECCRPDHKYHKLTRSKGASLVHTCLTIKTRLPLSFLKIFQRSAESSQCSLLSCFQKWILNSPFLRFFIWDLRREKKEGIKLSKNRPNRLNCSWEQKYFWMNQEDHLWEQTFCWSWQKCRKLKNTNTQICQMATLTLCICTEAFSNSNVNENFLDLLFVLSMILL